MNIKSTVLSLIAFASLVTQVHASEVESLESFREFVTTEILQDARNDVVGDLLESGVAEIDAEQIFFAFVNDVVDCIVGVTDEIAARRGVELDELLSNGSVEELNSLYNSDKEFEELLEPCVLVAVSNAGLNW